MNPQDRKIIEELMATGAMRPDVPAPQANPVRSAQAPEGMMGGYGAAVQGIQGARPTGGMVPLDPMSRAPGGGTPGQGRIGVPPDMINARQDHMVQAMMQQQPVLSQRQPNEIAGDPMAPDREPIRPGINGPLAALPPGQGPRGGVPSPEDQELVRMMLAQGGPSDDELPPELRALVIGGGW